MLDSASHTKLIRQSGPRKLAKPLILGISIFIIALLWGFVLAQTRFERAEAIEAAIRQNQNRAMVFEQYVLRTLDAANLAMDHIISTYIERERLRGFDPAAPVPMPLEDRVIADSPFAAVSIVRADGVLIATSLKPRPPAINVGDHPEFPRIIDQKEVTRISPPTASKAMDGSVLFVTRRIRNELLDGFVNVSLRPEDLVSIAKGSWFGPRDTISVIGLDGIIRARRDGDAKTFGENVAGRLVMRMQAARPNGTYLGPSSIDGKERYFSHRRLTKYALFVTSGVDPKAILAPVRARMRLYIAAASTLSLLIFASAWLLWSAVARREKNVLELSLANARLRQAQRVGLIGDWDFDPSSGEVTWSSNLREMYGRSSDQARSLLEDLGEYVGPQDEEKISEALQAVLVTGETQEYSLEVRLPNGDTSFRHIIAAPTYDAKGKIVGVHGTDQDVTAARRLEFLEARMVQVSRLDAMNIMASTLAHEINQPLSASANYLAATKKMLSKGEANHSDVMEMLELGGEQIQHAGGIIRTARQMVSGGEVSRVRVSIRSLIDGARKALPSSARGPLIEIILETGVDADSVQANAVQAQQVLINLCRNAIDSAPGREPKVIVRTMRINAEMVAIFVQDNGDGLSVSPGEVFTAFSTSKSSGLGMGLAISRTMVEDHGGRIWVEATGPEGTTIGFTLPAPDTGSNRKSEGVAA